jgi:hypothetical protein
VAEEEGSREDGRKDPGDGFFGRIFRPRKKQRVTLTRPGAKQAPMRRGKAKTGQTAEKEAVPPPARKAVKELQTLLAIGRRDPERLAGIISRMLREEDEKNTQAKLKFERLIWEKAEGKKPSRDAEA